MCCNNSEITRLRMSVAKWRVLFNSQIQDFILRVDSCSRIFTAQISESTRPGPMKAKYRICWHGTMCSLISKAAVAIKDEYLNDTQDLREWYSQTLQKIVIREHGNFRLRNGTWETLTIRRHAKPSRSIHLKAMPCSGVDTAL
jgi:hypothetical protein